MPHGHNESAEHESEPKGKIQTQPQFRRTHDMRRRMDVTAYILGVMFGILGLFGALLFSDGHHRDWGLWIACLAILCGVIGGFCWYQDRLWKQDADKNAAANAAVEDMRLGRRAWLAFVGIRIDKVQAEQPLAYSLILKNTSGMPAEITGTETHYYIIGKIVIDEPSVIFGDAEKFGSAEQRAFTPWCLAVASGIELVFSSRNTGDPLWSDKLEDIGKEDGKIIVVAQVKYTDRLGTDGHTRTNFIYHDDVGTFIIDPRKNWMA